MDLALLVQSHFCGSTVHSARSTSNTADGSCKLEAVGYGNKQAAALFFLHSQILTIAFLRNVSYMIELVWVASEDNASDALTKAVQKALFLKHRDRFWTSLITMNDDVMIDLIGLGA